MVRNAKSRSQATSTRPPLTQAQLKEKLIYFPETGKWVRVEDGQPVGGLVPPTQSNPYTAYIRMSINRISYRAHRLAFLYMTGKFPEGEVDHIDRDGTNNRWNNLRTASSSQNNFNMTKRIDNTSGIKGIFIRKSGRFEVRVNTFGKVYIKHFSSLEEAIQHRKEKIAELHGEYAREF